MVLAMMSRKRTIEPDFPTSRGVMRVSLEARLLCLLLRLAADDEGRSPGDPWVLTGKLYPSDRDALDRIPLWLDELEREKLIERYAHEHEAYVRLVDWYEHQRVDRPTPSKLPAPPSESREPREGLARPRKEGCQALGLHR